MPNEARVAIDRLQEATLDLLWRQWAALGQAAARPARAIVDVEALLLASAWFADAEARLVSAAASWRSTFDGLVSTQRLRNLNARAEPLVGETSSTPLASADAPGAKRRSDVATPLTVNAPSTLMLRLRLIMSVGAKADIVTVLLGRQADAALPEWILEQEAAYGLHAVRRVTRDLASSGILKSSRDGHHGLQSAERWWELLGVKPSRLPTWMGWATILLWIRAAHHRVHDAIARDVTSYGLGGLLDDLTMTTGYLLPAVGPVPLTPKEEEPGIPGFLARCRDLEQRMAEG